MASIKDASDVVVSLWRNAVSPTFLKTRGEPPDRMQWLILAMFVIFAVVSVARGIENAVSAGSGDLAPYFAGARQWLAGKSPYGIKDFLYLPQILFVAVPFSLGSWELCRVCWAASNAILLAILGILLLKVTASKPPIRFHSCVLLIAVLGWGPARHCICNGQVSVYTTTLLLAAILADRCDRRVLSGFFLSVALAKWTLSLPFLLVFVVRRRWDTLASCAIWTAAGILLYGLRLAQGPIDFAREYLASMQYHWHVKVSYVNTFDLASLGASDGDTVPRTAIMSLLIVLLACGTYAAWRRPGCDSECYLLACVALFTVCAIPHLRYDFVLLLLPAAFFWNLGMVQGRRLGVFLFFAISSAYWIQLPHTIVKVYTGGWTGQLSLMTSLFMFWYDAVWAGVLLIGLIAARPQELRKSPCSLKV